MYSQMPSGTAFPSMDIDNSAIVIGKLLYYCVQKQLPKISNFKSTINTCLFITGMGVGLGFFAFLSGVLGVIVGIQCFKARNNRFDLTLRGNVELKKFLFAKKQAEGSTC